MERDAGHVRWLTALLIAPRAFAGGNPRRSSYAKLALTRITTAIAPNALSGTLECATASSPDGRRPPGYLGPPIVIAEGSWARLMCPYCGSNARRRSPAPTKSRPSPALGDAKCAVVAGRLSVTSADPVPGSSP
jgi:hypothetical protein